MTRELEERVIERTVTERPPPEVATHWSTRIIAAATGLSRADVGRTSRKYGLKPHQIKRLKLSRDPRLVEKMHDVVSRYLDPPISRTRLAATPTPTPSGSQGSGLDSMHTISTYRPTAINAR